MTDTAKAVASFTDLYQRMVSERPFVSDLITGHLAIEFLLRRLLHQHDPQRANIDSYSHHSLVLANQNAGLITEAQRDVLASINSLRNKFSHEISYEPTIDELRQLWRKAGEAFVDMTDGIEQRLELLGSVTGLDEVEETWILGEFFIQICYDLHNAYVDRGGDFETF